MNGSVNIIETRGLVRRFGALTAVDRIDLDAPAGCIYGFLGPNGAGKTTTIRLLLGLIRPDAGEVRLFGKPLRGFRRESLARTGSLVEQPSLHPHLTGRENLEIVRILRRRPRKSVDKALAVVRLEKEADRLVGTYSLGMRQRLGLAVAVLGDPELLILDEPTNGLDPAGIREIRLLIRSLPGELGMTVFLSSHLLSEVEQVASHAGIVDRGRLVFQGKMADLAEMKGPGLEIRARPRDKARLLLAEAGYESVERDDGALLVADADEAAAAALARRLIEAGMDVSHLALRRATLEDVFLKMTGNGGERSSS